MSEQPDAAALLSIAADTLANAVIPHLAGKPAFEARIAARLIAIVARELEHAGKADAAAIAGLRAVLGREDGTLEVLTRELAARLRGGELSLATPPVATLLWDITMRKLEIDQPGFARYQQLRSRCDDH